MSALPYFEAPAHPLGIVTHPNWDAVRERWNALWCASVLNQARDERARQFRDQKEGGVSAPSSGSGDAGEQPDLFPGARNV